MPARSPGSWTWTGRSTPTRRPECRHHFESLSFAWCHDHEGVLFGDESLDQREKHLILPFHRRSQNQDLAVRDDRFEERGDLKRGDGGHIVEFHVTGDLDRRGRRSDGDEAPAVGFLARQDAIVLAKDSGDHWPKEAIARQRAIGDPSVREKQTESASAGQPGHVGPDLGLHGGKHAWLLVSEETLHGEGEVEGKVGHRGIGKKPPSLCLPGDRRRREYDRRSWAKTEDVIHHRLGSDRLADGDRMDPQIVGGGVRTKETEAFVKVRKVLAAKEAGEKKEWECDHKNEVQEDLVQQEHGPHHMTVTPVYWTARQADLSRPGNLHRQWQSRRGQATGRAARGHAGRLR